MTLQATVLLVPVEQSGDGLGTHRRPDDMITETAWRLPPPEIYELSTTRNLIHIVLDAFPSPMFVDILDADRLAFDRDWPGFTFFANHLGTHTHHVFPPCPRCSRASPFATRCRSASSAARHPSIFHVLGQQGYRLRSLASRGHDHLNPSFPGVDAAIRYDIPTPYGSYRDYVDVAAAQLLDLSLFRHAPHAFKPDIYRDRQWLLQQRIAARRGPEATAAQPFGDAAFLRDFANRITQGDDAPVYTFLHVITPHLPVVTDADCAYAPKSAPIPEDFADQARCALSAVGTLLQRLRDLDLYDRSAIIVTSDHGVDLDLIKPEDQHPLAGRSPAGPTLPRIESWATPLLLVKPFAAQGPLQTSYAPTAITDVPATLLDLAGLPDALGRGASVLRIDPAEPRQRTYAHHRPQARPNPFYDVLYVFSVSGRVDDPGRLELSPDGIRADG